MVDIFLEIIRAIVVGFLFFFIALRPEKEKNTIKRTSGWRFIVAGFCMIFFGSLIDITDNFSSLNKYIIIGNTEYQAFLEKIIGYLIGFISIAIGFWKWLPQIIENEKKAIEEIKQLSGLLPICSHCKKIRDDSGYWSQIEDYISQHSDAKFSHGICQKCAKKHYPDYDIYDD